MVSKRDFLYKLRGFVPFYGFSSYAIQVLFFKYVSQIRGLETNEQLNLLIDFMSMFQNYSIDLDIINQTYRVVEEIYNIEEGLLKFDIGPFVKHADEKANFDFFKLLKDLELPEDKNEMKAFIEEIISFTDNKDVSKTVENTTNSSLLKIVSDILDVKSNESFMDCFCGLFRSSLYVNANSYFGYDISGSSVAIANMIMILIGEKNFKIKKTDVYTYEDKIKVDKVFSDGPLSGEVSFELLLNTIEKKESSKTDYYNLKVAAECMNDTGKAVITCLNSVLGKKEYIKLRKELLSKNLIAVISLPSLWTYASSSTNLIVLSNNRKTDSIIMIDASSKDNLDKTDKRNVKLSDKAIEMINSALEGKRINSFSEVVKIEEIKKRGDFSWVPAQYIDKNKIFLYKEPSSSIERKLDVLYKKISLSYEKPDK